MVFVMRSILILQLQLWLLLIVMLSMITARSPLEMLASSVRAIQVSSTENTDFNNGELSAYNSHVQHEESASVTPTQPHGQHQVHHVYVPIAEYPDIRIGGADTPAFVLFSPKWKETPNIQNSHEINNRRQDDMEFSASTNVNNNQHPKQIMVAWPAGLQLPSRKIPLRFIAAMAVPVSSLNTDPLLTQGELSEVVYYSSMDLHKLNITGNNNEILKHNEYNLNPDDTTEYDEEPLYTEIETTVTPYEPTIEFTTYDSTVDISVPSTIKPYIFLPTPIPNYPYNDVEKVDAVKGSSSEVEEDRQRRSWSHEGTSPRAAGGAPIKTSSVRVRHWMDGESVAYIAVGTCCGLSVLTLAIVLLVLRLRGNSAARRRHFTITTLNINNNDHDNSNNDGINSSLDSLSDISNDSASLHLPQKLLNLMNSRSQEVSTHKLGSWFNGRPTTLSIRHGGNMAFPAPIRRFQVEVHEDEQEEEEEGEIITHISPAEILQVSNSSSEFSNPDDSTTDGDRDNSRSSVDVPPSLEPVLEGTDASDDSVSGSKHDTFIFWSTNSDRLV